MPMNFKFTKGNAKQDLQAKEKVLKAEISKKASMANKRLKRLEKNN